MTSDDLTWNDPRVKHDKLLEVMEKAGIPELERRLIINLLLASESSCKVG